MTPNRSHVRYDNASYQTCEHPAGSHWVGVVPPIAGDEWNPEPLAHVWIACTRCGVVLRQAPYAEALERQAARDRATEANP